MKITYYGHSCFGIHTAGVHLLLDPFITYNELAQGRVRADEVPADYILLSHAHQDHMADLVSIAQRTGATVVGSWEVHVWCEKQGLKTHPMNLGGNWQFPFGRVRCVEAVHSSSFPDGTYGGNPMGYVVESEGKAFYYAGDTALSLNMQLIPRRHKLDFAFLPIGDNFTMDVQDAVTCADFIQCADVIGMHYDTFGFIRVDHDRSRQVFAQAGKQLTLMEIGQTLEK
ncbi:MAG: metal-dependent hydrolase [Bacteroidetes bacterium]|nr:metal-dependent hydrolase [Bacteroidota bacterium]